MLLYDGLKLYFFKFPRISRYKYEQTSLQCLKDLVLNTKIDILIFLRRFKFVFFYSENKKKQTEQKYKFFVLGYNVMRTVISNNFSNRLN